MSELNKLTRQQAIDLGYIKGTPPDSKGPLIVRHLNPRDYRHCDDHRRFQDYCHNCLVLTVAAMDKTLHDQVKRIDKLVISVGDLERDLHREIGESRRGHGQ